MFDLVHIFFWVLEQAYFFCPDVLSITLLAIEGILIGIIVLDVVAVYCNVFEAN